MAATDGHDLSTDLTGMRCEACRKDSPAVAEDRFEELLARLPGWRVVTIDGVRQLTKTYTPADFASALDLANRIGTEADAEDHHPRFVVEWGSLAVSWWTHTIGGLHMNDFILAARCDKLAESAGN